MPSRSWRTPRSFRMTATAGPRRTSTERRVEKRIDTLCEICFRRVKGLSVEEYERLYGCKALLGEEEARV